MNKEELKELLDSNKIGKMKKAVKYIAKNNIVGFENEIIYNYTKYSKIQKSWEFVIFLLNVIYKQRFYNSIPYLKETVYNNLEYDIITIYSSMVYFSLSSKNKNDVSAIFEVANFCKYSVGFGILMMLGVDQKIPSKQEQYNLIELFKNFGIDRHKGTSDPRTGLASACINWEAENVKEFLNYCLETGDDSLIYVANNTLRGKKTNYNDYLLFYK